MKSFDAVLFDFLKVSPEDFAVRIIVKKSDKYFRGTGIGLSTFSGKPKK